MHVYSANCRYMARIAIHPLSVLADLAIDIYPLSGARYIVPDAPNVRLITLCEGMPMFAIKLLPIFEKFEALAVTKESTMHCFKETILNGAVGCVSKYPKTTVC